MLAEPDGCRNYVIRRKYLYKRSSEFGELPEQNAGFTRFFVKELMAFCLESEEQEMRTQKEPADPPWCKTPVAAHLRAIAAGRQLRK